MTHPPPRPVAPARVRAGLRGARRVVVLDDDPTGTQTVRDVPVLTRWTIDDVRWALEQDTAGFFVLTNTRSLDPAQAAARTREVASACLAAAAAAGVEVVFASRGDSTLRGHFPLETDVLAEVCAAHGQPVDAVLLAPSYLDAGRVTIDSVHRIRTAAGLLPVGESEFARDATFGYTSSHLGEWVAERTAGRIGADAVRALTLHGIRTSDTVRLAARLSAGSRADHPVVWAVDAEYDDDLRAVVLAVLAAEASGRRFLYRVGPSFVRARLGQEAAAPLSISDLRAMGRHTAEPSSTATGGLVVVGSHVGLTTRQLDRLRRRATATEVVLEVARLLGATAEDHLRAAAAAAVDALADGLVILSTSRDVVFGESAAASLDIARRVSAAVTRTVQTIVARRRPAFLVAKGGITAADVATGALHIGRAWVRGCLLPGVVSLWEPVGRPAAAGRDAAGRDAVGRDAAGRDAVGPDEASPHEARRDLASLPFVVFAGNVGDDEALADVVDRLTRAGSGRPEVRR